MPIGCASSLRTRCVLSCHGMQNAYVLAGLNSMAAIHPQFLTNDFESAEFCEWPLQCEQWVTSDCLLNYLAVRNVGA